MKQLLHVEDICLLSGLGIFSMEESSGEKSKGEKNMKRIIAGVSLIALFLLNCGSAMADDLPDSHKLLYQGHGSLRIVTGEGKERN